MIKNNALMTSNCFVPKQESVYGCQLGKQACLSAIFWYCKIMIANGTNITIARCRVFGMENIKGLPTIFFGNFKKKIIISPVAPFSQFLTSTTLKK